MASLQEVGHLDDLPDRLRQRIDVAGSGCWEWTGTRDRKGYSRITFANRRSRAGHRVVYEFLVGPIPDGLQIDHLCSNPPCVNPRHLEPVTGEENLRRAGRLFVAQTHCFKGLHELTPKNVFVQHNGRFGCRPCKNAANRRSRRRLASASP